MNEGVKRIISYSYIIPPFSYESGRHTVSTIQIKMRNTRNSRGIRKKSSPGIAHDKEEDDIVVTPNVAINNHGPTLTFYDKTSLEPNQAATPGGMFLSTLATIKNKASENITDKISS